MNHSQDSEYTLNELKFSLISANNISILTIKIQNIPIPRPMIVNLKYSGKKSAFIKVKR